MSESRKSVTLYLNDHCIEIIKLFALATKRSNSQAAEFLIENGAANYDVKAAAPKKAAVRQTPNARNTKVKPPAPGKLPAKVVREAAKAAETTKPRGRKPKAAVGTRPAKAAPKPTSARRKRAAAPARKQAA